ncbi:MAG: hypothetical protein ACXAC5_02235 [Promethearchaeota archaeon]|jgi:hypothetical protein
MAKGDLDAVERRKVAALITFPAGTTIQQVETFLAEWRGDLVKDANEIVFDEKHQVMSYDPTSDRPTIYQR